MEEQLKRPVTMKKITVPEKKSLHVLRASASGKFSVTASPEAATTTTPTKHAATATASDAQSKRLLGSPRAASPCLCSPTTHAGSFRCRLHRGGGGTGTGLAASIGCGLSEMGKKPGV
uniref:Uncharacterized protein n=1 Tax=Oryza punctata TaxID=4537 RepID=A0A0E0LDD4_ORYPU